jgi:hypothetical protein
LLSVSISHSFSLSLSFFYSSLIHF